MIPIPTFIRTKPTLSRTIRTLDRSAALAGHIRSPEIAEKRQEISTPENTSVADIQRGVRLSVKAAATAGNAVQSGKSTYEFIKEHTSTNQGYSAETTAEQAVEQADMPDFSVPKNVRQPQSDANPQTAVRTRQAGTDIRHKNRNTSVTASKAPQEKYTPRGQKTVCQKTAQNPIRNRVRAAEGATRKQRAVSLNSVNQLQRSARAAAAVRYARTQHEAGTTAVTTVKTGRKAEFSVKRLSEAVLNSARAAGQALTGLVSALTAGGISVVFLAVFVCIFGVVVCLYSSTCGTSYGSASVSSEVLAYSDVITEYAAQYGISDYVGLIEAVMMQESNGLGSDPMQATECGYNTLYPGGITDPEYSISIGIHELADDLQLAGVEDSSDLEHIRLALQGYNYGPGYISWAVSNYGGYSEENAAAFSEMMKARLGTSVYGDPEYAPHVLRYYSYNNLLAGNFSGSQIIISVAGNEVGYREGSNNYTKYGEWYGMPNAQWCAMFTSWCANQCGYIDAGICPRASYCPSIISWFKYKGEWYDSSIVPPAGAYILYDWNRDGTADHVGLVEYVQDGFVHTIEGNSSDMVRRNTYSLTNEHIAGYGIPAY